MDPKKRYMRESIARARRSNAFAIASTSLEDILRIEKEELEARRKARQNAENEYQTRRAERKRREELEPLLERELTKFISCFGNESQQIVFRVLCYMNRHSVGPFSMSEIKREVGRAIGPQNQCADTYREYLHKFVEHKYVSKHSGDLERYSPTDKGLREALQGVVRMMEWEVEHKISSNLFVGLSRSKKDGGYYSMRIKILRLLFEDAQKEWTRSALERRLGIGNKSLMHHIEILSENRLIKYESIKKGRDEHSKKLWLGNQVFDVDRAIEDSRLIIYPKALKPRIIRALSKSKKGLGYKEVAKIVGIKGGLHRVSSFLSNLCRLGYAYSRWKSDEKLSEAQIAPLGSYYIKMLNGIRDIPLNPQVVPIDDCYETLARHCNAAATLYFPHSRTYKIWMAKKPALVSYLKKRGEASAEEIYCHTPVKNNILLRVGLNDGTLKLRKARVKHDPIPYLKQGKSKTYYLGGSHETLLYSIRE